MNNKKARLILCIAIIFLGLILIQTSVLGTNENIELLKNQNDYLIYIKDNLNSDFEFSFSNNKNENKDNLVFTEAETDSTKTDANKIAFINSGNAGIFNNTTYMWAKDIKGNYIVDGVEIDLSKALNINDLNYVSNITKYVEIDLTKTNTEEENINDKKVTTIMGKAVLPQDSNINRYIILKASESEENLEIFNLAMKISKFNSKTDMYTKIKIYNRFNKLLENTSNNILESNWKEINKNEIEQPKDARDGEEYILILGENDGRSNKIMDFQFLTSTRKESQEKAIEKITTKLPITYDNNILLIAFIILIIATIIVSVIIKRLEKKQRE